MLVLKFGGSSVGSPKAIAQVMDIVTDAEHTGRTRLVVVSAFSGVTDTLISMAKRAADGDLSFTQDLTALFERHLSTAQSLCAASSTEYSICETEIQERIDELHRLLGGIEALRELSPKSLDAVLSFGERLSAFIIAAAFRANGTIAEFLDARELIVTNNDYGNALWRQDQTFKNICEYVDTRPALHIATGFIARSLEGRTSTLGRGGSDLTAAIFAAALQAEEVQIWTDVDGILSADPAKVSGAFLLPSLSYEEAMELSHFGAKVLYPPTVRPALERKIPINIRNTFNPSCLGTRIVMDAESGPHPVRGISSIGAVSLLRVEGPGMVGVSGVSSRLFGALARESINVILITQASSEHSICLAVLPSSAESAVYAIQQEFNLELERGAIRPVVREDDLAIIAVVGQRMQHSSGIAGKVFHALGRNGINIVAIAQGSSELNISAVISKVNLSKALNAVHEAFFLSGQRSVNLYLVGLGLIGGTLLKQLERQRDLLCERHRIRINLVGAANSRRMVFNENGIEPAQVAQALTEHGEAFNADAFILRMKQLNLPNSAFCDCTASDAVSAIYLDILKAAIPVITPNKRANSGNYAYYRELKAHSGERTIPYLYETTVCAGLPVISTLNDLSLSGDRVRRIEAVLSGTLSFIFNNFDGSRSFSSLVKEAKEKGYTEPDPRDDLNAMDAARKALILARECGYEVEFDSIEIEPILPQSCLDAPDVASFFVELEKADAAFEQRRQKAEQAGKALRYLAVIEDGKARLQLAEVEEGHPSRSLVDSDNIVIITTERYSSLPLVIKGPGAGAEVTAGGVFADIVRIARTLV